MRRLVGLAALGAAVLAVVEILLLIAAVHYLGGALTLLLVLATAVLGFLVVRRQGGAAWRRFRRATAAGGAPAGREVTGPLLGLFGGVLLILPGFLTDVAGALLQVPPVRRLGAGGARRLVERRLPPSLAGEMFGPRRVRVRTGHPRRTDPSAEPPPVVEGEIVDPPPGP